MFSLESPIDNLHKIQKPQIAALKKLGILNMRDLLLYFPYRHLDFSKVIKIENIKADESISIKVRINSISGHLSFRSHISLTEALVSDDTGSLKVTWFNQPYLAKSLKVGDELFLSGKPDYYNSRLQLTSPIYEKVSDFPIHTSRLVPLYHLKQEIYPKTFRNYIKQVLPLADEIKDILPAETIHRQSLPGMAETIKCAHFPESADELENAKRRLAFEEIFINQLAAQRHKMQLAAKSSFSIKFNEGLAKNFVAALPFTLTNEQKRAAWQVLQDMEKPFPMNRLVEGDVGSGKTVVALMAALQAVNQGLQVAFLAPTEILAKQHFETVKSLASILKNSSGAFLVCLLTNNFSQTNEGTTEKDKLQKYIKTGKPAVYIGTQALLQEKVQFKKLALVIIDEQHRFGVEQRSQLIMSGQKVPHLLSLTATPIPRTLQLAFYGELDISQIKNKPEGRKPIITKLVADENRSQAYEFINKQILAGRQAFVITPLIEQNPAADTKSAKTELENLQNIFPKFHIGLLHGRLKGSEKEEIMRKFLQNRIQILVSTSVVEVGVDVPNASIMVIEGAERFGLSQLHQFRGRVGRAHHQSYCFLFMSPRVKSDRSLGNFMQLDEKKSETQTRLEAFTKIHNGFQLAELDLKQRGFGDIYGFRQSGWDFKYFTPSYTSLIEPARQEAKKLLEKDFQLSTYPHLSEKILDKTVHFE